MRVLLVGKGPPERGGIPSSLTALERGLRAAGDDVRVLNLSRPDLEPQGGRATWPNLRRTLRDVRALWQEAAAHDIVHVHSAAAPLVTFVRAVALVLVARLRGSTGVLHVHGGLVQRWLVTPGRRRLVGLAGRVPHRIVTVSHGARDALLAAGLPAASVVTVRNGVETQRFATGPRGSDPPTVLYVGLLTPRKGVLDLFAASRRLRGRELDHRLVLVGGTPDEGSGAEREVRRAAPPWAELTGPVAPEAIAGHYRDADVFCLPSWWEAMPLTVLEAMASGLPVVATDVGDLRWMVDDGVHGSLVPARDVAALTDAVEALLRDPAERRRRGRAARQRARSEFDLATTVAAVRREYRTARGDGR